MQMVAAVRMSIFRSFYPQAMEIGTRHMKDITRKLTAKGVEYHPPFSIKALNVKALQKLTKGLKNSWSFKNFVQHPLNDFLQAAGDDTKDSFAFFDTSQLSWDSYFLLPQFCEERKFGKRKEVCTDGMVVSFSGFLSFTDDGVMSIPQFVSNDEKTIEQEDWERQLHTEKEKLSQASFTAACGFNRS